MIITPKNIAGQLVFELPEDLLELTDWTPPKERRKKGRRNAGFFERWVIFPKVEVIQKPNFGPVCLRYKQTEMALNVSRPSEVDRRIADKGNVLIELEGKPCLQVKPIYLELIGASADSSFRVLVGRQSIEFAPLPLRRRMDRKFEHKWAVGV